MLLLAYQYLQFWNGIVWVQSDGLIGNNFDSGFDSSVNLSNDGNTLAIGASSQFWKGYPQVFLSNKDCEYVQVVDSLKSVSNEARTKRNVDLRQAG